VGALDGIRIIDLTSGVAGAYREKGIVEWPAAGGA